MLEGVLPTIDEVQAAAERLHDVLQPTDCVRSSALSQVAGVDVFLKRELDNPTGSFKVRGAYNVLASMPAEWIKATQRTEAARTNYCNNHLLGTIPDSLIEFRSFYDARRAALRNRIVEMIGVGGGEAGAE